MKASFEPKDAPVQGVVWSSSNEQVATVDQNGKVTGVKRGSVRITALAKDGSYVRGTVNLQVVQFVSVEERMAYASRAKEAIYNALNEHGIEIPFPQRDLYIKSMPAE